MKLPNAPAAVLEEFEPRILYTADAAALVLATDGEPLVRQLQALHSQNPVQQQPTVRELVVVDLSLPDAQVLLAGLQAQREAGRAIDILTLDARTDGIAAIGQALEGRNGVEAVHVLSHGEPGVLRLGAVQLDAGSLLARADELAAWSLALSAEADLLLYGCDVGAAAGGSQLLNALAQLTGADVAASTDDTGAAMLGGNWHLERSTGEVQAPLAIDVPTQQAWGQLMAASDAPVIVVNTTANKSQTTAALNRGSQQAVAHDAQGNFVVVWSSLNQDGSDWGVYARRFDIYGNPLSGEIQVNALTNRAQQYARVASDDAGNFVVTWTSDRQDGEGAGVYARTFRADGTPMSGDILVNTTTDGDQRNSVIGMNRSTGAFVVAWQGNGTSDNDGVFYRRFDSTGAALDINERRAHGATSGAQTNPAVAMDRSDRFVITWNDDDKVYFQRFNASGTMNGSRAQADAILSTSSAPALAMEDAGNFTIVYRETQIATGIWGRGFMANGTQRYTWFQAAGGDASSPSIEMAANGEFVVTWQAGGVADQDIYARRYSANGNANGAAFIVNTYTNNLQQAPSVAVLDSEHFAVVWSGKTTGDVTAVMARAYVAAPANPVITSDGGGANASLTVTENTTAVTTVTATDINRPAQTLSFSISGGDDAAKFAIDASTGVLRFLAAPNREAPADANEDHVYEVSVRVSDGSLNDTQDLLVTVANAVDEPEAVDDYASTQQATGVTVNLIANDGSPTGAPLRLLDVGAPSQGSVVIGSSAVTYTPSTSFVGTERLAYWVDDGAQDLRHYWRMDGNLQDQVGGLNGSTTGTVATVDGRWGRAIDFGASTGRFELPDVDYGEGFSLGFWFKLDPTQTNTWQTFLGHGGWRTQNSLDIAFSGPTGTDQNKLVTWVYDGNDDTSGGEIVADASAIWASGGWHHYLLTVTPGEGSRVYLDGTLAGTSSNGADGVNPNMPMVLGHNGTRSGPTVYRGAMDGLAVWGHALSAAERNEVTSGASARGDLFVSVSATPVTQPPAAVADTYLIAEGTSLSAATMAAPWYDTQWASRRLVSIDNVLGPQITNATLRVVLDTPALIAAGMKADGSDLRFADPDGTGLSHAVESWSSSGNSVVWVKVPVVDANSSSDRVFLYFGNPAAASVASAASVWGASAALVLNMEPNLVDLSPAATPVTQTLTTDVAGRVDRGRSFDGANSDIDLGSAAALDNIFSGGGAVSAWMHAWSWGEGGFGRIFDKASDPDSHQGWALEVQTDGSLLFEVGLTGGVARWDTPAGMLQLNQWHHVGVVFNSSTPTVAPIFYINGAPFTGIPDSVATGTATSDAGFDLHVGNHAQAPSRTFHGILDEVRVWTGSRDAGQMQAEYRSNYSATATLQPGGVQMASVLGNDRDPANLPMTVTLVSGPQHADSFGLNADGSFNYTPAPDWYGNDSFVYRASNGTLLSPPVTVTVRVANVPDAPVIMTHGQASVANLSKPENQLAVVRLEAKDVDDQNGAVTPLSWSIVGGADAALFVLDAQTGELRFAQAPDHETPGDVGADNNYQIIVQVSDGALVDQQTINITVTDVPEVARALPDTASTAWQTPVSVNVLANDLNFDSPSLGLLDISAASQGTVQMANSLATQRVVYDPGASYFGTQTLRYRLNDPLQGLQHYWRLDGDARDAIGSAHGTLINGPSAVAGTWGQALRFDGINDQVRLPDLSYSNGFTLAFWFRADDNSGTGYPTLYSHGPRGTANSLSVHFSGTGVGASAGPGMLRTWLLDGNDADDRYGLDVPAADLANGQWHLYTLVTTPGVGSEVFIDGVLRASSAVGNSAFNPSGNAWLGRTANSAAEADRMFKGDLDALALYGRSLAAEEVSGLFAGGEGEGTVSITVAAPPPLPPVISSNGGGAAAAISLAENQLAVTTVLATDPNGTPPALTYSIAGGADAARFTIDGTSGQLRFAATPDAESPWPSAQAGRYVVIVKVSDGALEDTQTLTVTVTDVDEFDVSVPADVDPELNVAAENAPPGQYVGITVAAADADATLNGITYSLIDDAGGRFVIDAVTGQVRTAAVLDAEAAAQYSIVVQARSADGSTSQASHSIDVLDVDEFDVSPPVDQDAASDALPENSAVGALVPLRVQAVDGDRTQSSVSYSLIDDAGGRFVIDALSGQVRLAAPLDAEAASSHTITVCATSADGSSSQASFSIAVNDVDEFDVTPLVDADPAVNAVSESAAVGTAVPLRAQASDPDSTNNSVSYSLVNSASGRFAIDAVTGQVRIAAALSAEAATSHLITVRATSADGSSSQASYSIAVIDVDEFDVTVPVDADPAANALAEDAAVGTAVPLRVQAIDGDLTNSSVSYSLLDDAGGRFVIDAATGQVSLAASLDAEAAASHTITVRASSADGSQSQASFTIAVNDVDEFDVSPLVDADLAANAVSESAAVGTAVPLRVQASDGDLTHSVVSYSLIDDAGGRFAIDAGTGQVSVAARLDAETVTSHTVTVRASSADGSSSQASFTIRVDDVDEFDVTAPVDADPAADALAEDAAVGTPVPLRVQAIDGDLTNTSVSYSLLDDAGGRFVIDALSGQVSLAASLDAEAATSHTITVRASSADGSQSQASFTIGVNDVDEFDLTPLVDVDPAADALPEDAAIGARVPVRVQASDGDRTNSSVSYSLIDDAGGRFAIDAGTGQVSVAARLDAETVTSHTVTVRASSADGSSSQASFTIRVDDVDEFDVTAPVDADPAADALAEDAAVGTPVPLRVQAIDADLTNASVSYSLLDDAGGRFAIDAGTGQVSLAAALDAEAATSHTITVRASSADGSQSQASFTIAVNDVDEFDLTPLVDVDPAADALPEDAAIGALVPLRVQASDGDRTNSSVSYSLIDDAGGRFAIDAGSGQVSVAARLDAETATSHTITVRASSADGSSSQASFSIAVNDVDEFDVTLPVDADTAVNRIPLGAVAGATIGLHVTARDADILNSGVSYRLLDDAGGRFAIDAASGEVTLARSLAGEWLSQHLLQVEARSADGSTAQASFAVEVELEPRAPVFTSSDRFSVPENQRQVGTVTATDEDSRPGPLRFTISGGADAAQFEIDAVSGQLRFRTAPDAEAPLDADRDNRYELRVQASDGALVTEQAIQVVVTGVDEAPQRINNSLSVHNGQVQLSLLTRDPESPAAALVYTVSSDVGGWFALASAPAQRLASFTQAQVDAGEVIFRLDGTGRMPGYRLAVSDGTHSLPPTAPSLSIIGPIPVIGQVSSAPAAPAEAAPAAAPPASSSASTAAAAEAAAEAEATRKKAASGKLAGSAISGTLPGAEPGTPDRVTVDSPVARLTGNTSAFAATGGAPASPLLRPVMLRSEDVMVTSGLADVLRPMAISDNSLSWRFLGAQDVADPAARSSLLQALDRVRDDVAGQDIEGTVVIGTSALVSGGLSVGYVLWLLRGGVLIATMVSAVPAWAGIDPLPVLAQGRGQDEDDAEDEGDPIERLFSRARRLIHRPEAATPSHAAAEVPVAPSAASPLPAGLAEGPVAAAQPAPASAAQKLQELDA